MLEAGPSAERPGVSSDVVHGSSREAADIAPKAEQKLRAETSAAVIRAQAEAERIKAESDLAIAHETSNRSRAEAQADLARQEAVRARAQLQDVMMGAAASRERREADANAAIEAAVQAELVAREQAAWERKQKQEEEARQMTARARAEAEAAEARREAAALTEAAKQAVESARAAQQEAREAQAAARRAEAEAIAAREAANLARANLETEIAARARIEARIAREAAAEAESERQAAAREREEVELRSAREAAVQAEGDRKAKVAAAREREEADLEFRRVVAAQTEADMQAASEAARLRAESDLNYARQRTAQFESAVESTTASELRRKTAKDSETVNTAAEAPAPSLPVAESAIAMASAQGTAATASARQFIDLAVGRIGYRREGSGPRVVLLHPWGSSMDSMEGAFKALASHFEVLAMDLPAHGQSFSPGGTWEIKDFTACVLELMDKLHFSQSHIVARGFGGSVAAQLAMDHPQRVGNLVLDNLALAGPESARTSSEERSKGRLSGWFKARGEARGEASGEEVIGPMGHAPRVNLAAILPSLHSKVLVICDEDHAAKMRDEIKRLMPRSEMISVRNDNKGLYNEPGAMSLLVTKRFLRDGTLGPAALPRR